MGDLYYIYLIASNGAEASQGLFRIVFFTEETLVDEILDTDPQRIKQDCDDQGGNYNDDWGLLIAE